MKFEGEIELLGEGVDAECRARSCHYLTAVGELQVDAIDEKRLGRAVNGHMKLFEVHEVRVGAAQSFLRVQGDLRH